MKGNMKSKREEWFAKLEADVPKYIYGWIEEYSKEIAMTPGQLITQVFHRYYEVWHIAQRRMKDEIAKKIDELKKRAKSEEAKRILEELEKEIAMM